MSSHSKTIAIHQPNYMPWLGFFYKIEKADAFVLLDTVDFQIGNANSITHRTKIKTAQGELFISQPTLKKSGPLIKDIELDSKQNWAVKHLKTIQLNYSKAPQFKTVYPWLEQVFSTFIECNKMAEVNCILIKAISQYLEIATPIAIASQLPITTTDKNLRLIELCKYFDGTIYLSGNGARAYNDEALYQQHDLAIAYTSFKPSAYNQLHGEFVAGLSIIDVMMNCSKEEIAALLQ